jgi:dihydrofolate reductase
MPHKRKRRLSGHVFIATSLDGYIARSNGSLDWLSTHAASADDHGYRNFIRGIDGIVMGRGTFETVLSFDAWPYEKPVVVMSRSLTHADVRADVIDKVTVTDLVPTAVMEMLSAKGWRRAYVDGGQVIQSFLRAGLIDDMVVTRIPVLLGSGLPLFGPLDRDLRLKHLGTTAFRSGLVQSKYEILNPFP